MKEKINKEVTSYINELRVKDELKQELNYFIEKTIQMKNTESSLNLNVIIDERSEEDIAILLEHMIEILKIQELYKEYVKYKKSTSIDDIYDSVIIVNNFDIFYDRILDAYRPEKRLTEFVCNLKKNNDMLILTYNGKINDRFEKISKEIFDPELCIHIKRNNKNGLYNELIERYNAKNIKHKLSYDSFTKIISSLENKGFFKNSDGYIVDYLYDYSIKKMVLNKTDLINTKIFDEFIEKKTKKNQTKIEELIGLANIKKELDSLCKYLEFAKQRKITNDMYLNLFFLGNPGTGKTTVARMYAERLYKMGLIKENKLIEVVPNDLIGEYVGQTRRVIRGILDDAEGGVLFIDEAYLLHSNSYKNDSNPYMEEAVVELIKYLEEPKNVVIFAGYPDEMRKMYDANPGIKSRIYKEIYFDDYSNKELYQILENNLKKKHLEIDAKSKTRIIKYIDNLKQDKNFGNARSMLQLSQTMIMNHANGSQELTINYKDLPKDNKNKKQRNNAKMGFGTYD